MGLQIERPNSIASLFWILSLLFFVTSSIVRMLTTSHSNWCHLQESSSVVITKVCIMWVYLHVQTANFDCYKNKFREVFVRIQEFPALFVRTLTFSLFERCNELPLSHWKEQYLFNYHEEYALTLNVYVHTNYRLEVHKPLLTHAN